MKEFTVKQIADELNITKPTVRKYLKQLKIEPIRKEVNRLLYSGEAANSIAAAVGSSFLFELEKSENRAENSEMETEKSKKPLEEAEKLAEKRENTENSAAFDSILVMLREEIAKKDKEIAELKKENQKKDERIERLYLTIQENADKALYITAADKTAAIMDKSQLQKDNSKSVNKKWYQFWK